ncbi:MAG: hypothetical protein ACTHXG_14600 [Micrococcaceae bacterium]
MAAATEAPRRLPPVVLAVLLTGAASTAGHVWMLLAHPHGAGLTVVMVAMTLWCAYCTAELWVRPTVHCLRRLCLMSLAMVAVHAVLVAGVPGLGGIGGHAHPASAGGAVASSTDHATAMLLMIVVELGVALTAGLALRLDVAPRCIAAQTETRRKVPDPVC